MTALFSTRLKIKIYSLSKCHDMDIARILISTSDDIETYARLFINHLEGLKASSPELSHRSLKRPILPQNPPKVL